jgi:tRNA dimethylallyltransferase
VEDRKPKLLFLIGPTASGKSDVALKLAETLQAEIISADSMQIYREMDIGTAKINEKIRLKIPHHLMDVITIEEEYSVFDYCQAVSDLLNKKESQGKTFIIVGGTGLYIKALLHGISDKPGADEKIREKLENVADEKGLEHLRDRLAKIDPEYAKIVCDKRRVIRALEVYELSGKTVTEWNQETHGLFDKGYTIKLYGLRWPKEILKQRIENRARQMVEGGLLTEIERLKHRAWSKTARQAIGYAEAFQVLEGKLKEDKLIPLIVKNTAAMAKRQMTWFKKEKAIHWLHLKAARDLNRATIESLEDWKLNG